MRLYRDVAFPIHTLVNFCDMNETEARAVIRKVGSAKVFTWIEQLKNRGREDRRKAITERAATGGYASIGEMLVSDTFLDAVARDRRNELRRAHACALSVNHYLRSEKADPVALNRSLVLTRMSRYVRLEEIAQWPVELDLAGVKKEFRTRLEAHWRKLYPHLTASTREPRPQVIPGEKPGYLRGQSGAGALLATARTHPPTAKGA